MAPNVQHIRLLSPLRPIRTVAKDYQPTATTQVVDQDAYWTWESSSSPKDLFSANHIVANLTANIDTDETATTTAHHDAYWAEASAHDANQLYWNGMQHDAAPSYWDEATAPRHHGNEHEPESYWDEPHYESSSAYWNDETESDRYWNTASSSRPQSSYWDM